MTFNVKLLSTCFEYQKLFKDPALLSESVVSVSYVVSEILVKNKTLQLLRKTKQNKAVQHKMEHFVVTKLAIVHWVSRHF